MHGLACHKLGLHEGEATWFCLCGFSECLCIPICPRSETVLEMFFWDCLQELLCNFLCMDFVPLPACNYFFTTWIPGLACRFFFFYTSLPSLKLPESGYPENLLYKSLHAFVPSPLLALWDITCAYYYMRITTPHGNSISSFWNQLATATEGEAPRKETHSPPSAGPQQ